MKRILLFSALALLIASCNSGNEKKASGPSHTKVIETSMENVDSLNNVIPSTWKNLKTIVEGVAHTGNIASKIDSVNRFSLVYEARLGDMDEAMPTEIEFTAYGCALQPDSKAILVVSVNGEKFYKGVTLDTLFTNVNEWKQMNFTFTLPDNLKKDDIMKAYVWNNGIGELLVDDFKLEIAY